MDMAGVAEEGEGGMYGESNMETYITICKIESQWDFAEWLRELKLSSHLVGWGGEGSGKKVQEGGNICIHMAVSC